MSKLYHSLKSSLAEAIEIENGQIPPARIRKIIFKPLPCYQSQDIKNLRQNLHLTQASFSQLVGVSIKTVEAWEAGTNIPNGSAQRLLEIFKNTPATVKQFICLE